LPPISLFEALQGLRIFFKSEHLGRKTPRCEESEFVRKYYINQKFRLHSPDYSNKHGKNLKILKKKSK